MRWTTRSPVRLCGSSASDRSCSSARHKCKHDCVHFWPPVFHISDLVRDLFSITLRFQTPLLSTLSYLWSTFHYFLCLSWFFFSRFFVPFVVALLPSKAGNLRPCKCSLACSRITGTKCAVSHYQLVLNHVTAWCRQKRWKDLVHILLAKRSTLKVSAVGFNLRRSLSLVNMLLTSKFWYQLCLLQILLQDMIPPEQNSSLIPNAESENVSEVESTFVAKDGAQSPDGQFETSKKKILDLAQIAFLRIEQVRFKLARLGKSRSLHEVFEGNRHFYYPQRLLISFSLSLVGAVFFLAVFMYLISESCKVLTSWRKQILNILAQVDSFIGAAPTYLKLMSSGLVSGLAGALTWVNLASWRVTWITRSRWWCYWYWFACLGFFFFAARGKLCNCVQCPSIFIPALPWWTWVISLILCFIGAGDCPVYYIVHKNARTSQWFPLYCQPSVVWIQRIRPCFENHPDFCHLRHRHIGVDYTYTLVFYFCQLADANNGNATGQASCASNAAMTC